MAGRRAAWAGRVTVMPSAVSGARAKTTTVAASPATAAATPTMVNAWMP